MSLDVYIDMSDAEQRRTDAQQARRLAAFRTARGREQAASAAKIAVIRELLQKHAVLRRMREWIVCPKRLTPFPWEGDEFIQPCNSIDLDYYEKRPDACPSGVREWLDRYRYYRTPDCDHHEMDSCMYCEAAHDMGTMRSVSRYWRIPDSIPRL